ncbi:MAG: hypothetical protein AABX52_02870 [Nanoarchaeota archaeon]
MKSEGIQYCNLKELSPVELDVLNKLCAEYYDKVKRCVHNLVCVRVHVKCHNKLGKRKKYDVHLQVVAPMRSRFTSSKAHDWDLVQSVHKAFADILSQIEHELKGSARRSQKHLEGHAWNLRRHSYGRVQRNKIV